ncbi:hypothetical protein M662_18705 [Bacillus sp. SB49]|nr:hypothetical protein M662_18705 [Bacillus sp. SB49]
MSSDDRCGKGKLPKLLESHLPEAGSDTEEVQDCHIGDYMEGYLTQERIQSFYGSSDSLVAAVFVYLLR